jgi:hypothetical protein
MAIITVMMIGMEAGVRLYSVGSLISLETFLLGAGCHQLEVKFSGNFRFILPISQFSRF